MMTYRTHGKRVLDVGLAGTALVLLSPVAGVVALLIKWRMGSPVIFRQQRSGLGEESFELIKFRTMLEDRNPDGEYLPDSRRLTPLGVLLRRTSLDELPEVVNVLRGDMSIVGPRPMPLRYTPYFTVAERRRFHVRPGITGLAQSSGRNAVAWDRRFEFDRQYVEEVSLLTDLKIIGKTMIQVLRRTDVLENPGAHMEDLDIERARSAPPLGIDD